MKKLRESITHYTLSTPRKRTKHLWAQYSSVARRSPIRNRLSLTTTQINNVLILKVNYWTRMQRRKRQADTDSFKIKNSGGKKTGTRHGWEMVGERRGKGENWERLLTSRTWTLSKVLFECKILVRKRAAPTVDIGKLHWKKRGQILHNFYFAKNHIQREEVLVSSSFSDLCSPIATQSGGQRHWTAKSAKWLKWTKNELNGMKHELNGMKHDMVWYDLIDQFRIRTLPNRLTTSAHLTRSTWFTSTFFAKWLSQTIAARFGNSRAICENCRSLETRHDMSTKLSERTWTRRNLREENCTIEDASGERRGW